MTLPNDNLPVRIDRAALDRIIQRATELQTGEREVGDNLTPDEVLALGRDVGIPAKYLEQAMLEHRSAVAVEADNSALGRVFGPGVVRAQRVVRGEPDDVLASLQHWMDKNELMVVQRQQPGWASWEPLRGMQAAIRRGAASLDTSKPKFMLSRAELVVATVRRLESDFCHIGLEASLRSTRREYVAGSSVALGFGGVAGGALTFIAASVPALPVALAAIPVALGGLIAFTVTRSYRPVAERVQLGLERALDFLERGGVKPAHELSDRPPGLLDVIATEMRRALGPGGPARRSSRSSSFPDGPQ